jgi:hypothetical protein
MPSVDHPPCTITAPTSASRALSFAQTSSILSGVDVLVLFTPEDSEGVWRVRVFPASTPSPIPGLSEAGEAGGLVAPDFGGLDERMLAARAGYSKRLHPSGVMEITATGRGADALCEWVTQLLKATSPDG